MPSDIDRIEFVPRREPGALRSFSLALLVHLLLVAALTWGVNWTRSKPDMAFEAELWSSLPQEAAPRAPPVPAPPVPEIKPPAPPTPPPPPPPEPVVKPVPAPPPEVDIALEQEKKRKLLEKKAAEEKLAAELKKKEEDALKAKALALEKRKAEEEAKRLEAEKLAAKKREAEKLAAEKKEAEQLAAKKREAERVAKLRQENLERMRGQAGATGADDAKGSAQQSSGPSGSYAGKVRAKVKPNIVFTETISGNPTAEVEVRTTLDGSISSQRLIKSSGNKAWDDAVMKAIVRTQSMPRDIDGRVPTPMILEFRPND